MSNETTVKRTRPSVARIIGWSCTAVWLLVLGNTTGAECGFLQIRNGYFWDPDGAEYFLPRGIAYQTWNPPVFANQSLEQLDYDLVEFKKMYANSVRVDLVWGELERSPGVYDWSKADHLVKKATELGLKLFVLIGYQYPPAWFPDEWRGVNDHGWTSNVLNYEHPNARLAYSNHITAVTARYKTSPAIAAWILGNEYAYFDLWEPLSPGESHRMLGYDPVSQMSFRTCLSSGYQGNIALLNSNWGTSYPDFDSVVMPNRYPTNRHHPAYHDLIQWRKKSVGDFVAVGAAAAQKADPNHLSTYSMVGLVYSTDDDNNTCEDAKSIVTACRSAGAPLDFWSINNYAWSKVGSELRTADFGIAKYQAQSGLPLMISETGYSDTENQYSGAGGRHAKAVPSQLWEAIMSGAVGVHLFHWNDRDQFTGDFARERGFGIVRQNRTAKKPVYENVLKVFRRMEELNLGRLVGGSRDPKPDIQFFWSTNADMGWPRANYENASIWGALKRLGYQPGIIDDEQFERGDYTNARALLLSRCYQMNPSHLDLIANAVIPAGIHVHANADLPGQFNCYHWPNSNWAARMNFLFGLDVAQARPGLDSGVTGLATYKRVYFNAIGSLGSLRPGYTEHLDTWKIWYGVRATASGSAIVNHTGIDRSQPPAPALVVKSHGLARTAVNAFALGDTTPIWKEEPPLTREWDVRSDWLGAIYRTHFGIAPMIELTGPGARYVAPDYRVCRNGSVLISMLNEHTNSASVTLTANSLLSGKTVENLTSGGVLATNLDGTLSLDLSGDDFVLLYAYSNTNGADGSLVNPSPHKIWFESAPMAIWPNGSGYDVTVGYETRDDELNLVVSLELVRSINKTYGKSAAVSVRGKGSSPVQVPVPDADLNDLNYVSSRTGARYVWHAWLERAGVRVNEVFLPVRLLWGVRPLSLPTGMIHGRTYTITLNWEELPSSESVGIPTPLSRADLWESVNATAEHFVVGLVLQSDGMTVASNLFVTSTGTDGHSFSIKVPPYATEPYTWLAFVQAAPDVASHDVQDSFEGRMLGALTVELRKNTNASSPIEPWTTYHYPSDGAQRWFDEGVQLHASEGSQSAFLIVTNPAPPLGYSGFGISYVFDQEWALPQDSGLWRDYAFSCDFKLAQYRRCIVELQVKNDDPGGTGRWIQFTNSYDPGSNEWHTIHASLDRFVKPPWSFASFDPNKVREIVVNVQMLETNVTYEAAFDNIRFDGPDILRGSGATYAIYQSDNDSPRPPRDSDGDGIPDIYETGTGIYVSPQNTGTSPNKADTDGDGQTDGQELQAGTNPNSASDFFTILDIRPNERGEIVISWLAHPGRFYGVYYCDEMHEVTRFVPLENLTNLTVQADGLMEVVDRSAAESNKRFYQIVVQAP